MKIHDVKQGTPEWFDCRLGIPTASEFSVFITPKKGEISKSEAVDKYVCRKVAEKWLGRSLEVMGRTGSPSEAMDRGKILEHEALPYLDFEHGMKFLPVGFCTHDDPPCGCSPDGGIVVANIFEVGAEIKCPNPETHVAYLRDGVLPSEYIAQVQGSMFVTDADRWHFLSWCRGFPPLHLVVERDQAYMAKLYCAITKFWDKFNGCWDRLVELNGGEPDPARFVQTENGYALPGEENAIAEFYDEGE